MLRGAKLGHIRVLFQQRGQKNLIAQYTEITTIHKKEPEKPLPVIKPSRAMFSFPQRFSKNEINSLLSYFTTAKRLK